MLRTQVYHDTPGHVRMLVEGDLFLNGVKWQVSGWLHLWSDELCHLGLESDSRDYALKHSYHASKGALDEAQLGSDASGAN